MKRKNNKLTPDQVSIIRDPANAAQPANVFARAWGVSAETIRKVRRGETWNAPQAGETFDEGLDILLPKEGNIIAERSSASGAPPFPSQEEIDQSLSRLREKLKEE